MPYEQAFKVSFYSAGKNKFSVIYTVGSKIIRALGIFRVQKIVFNAVS